MMQFFTLKIAILNSMILFCLVLNSTKIQGQSGSEPNNSKIQSVIKIETEGIIPEATSKPNTLPFKLQITHINQFMQSTQLFFKLT
ncbi:MAG: hypothetical protein Q7V19_17790, partial [Bacteroidales bacterium]|nr:hypothetical protein [Bacteroidales bacterium]